VLLWFLAGWQTACENVGELLVADLRTGNPWNFSCIGDGFFVVKGQLMLWNFLNCSRKITARVVMLPVPEIWLCLIRMGDASRLVIALTCLF